MSRRFIAIALVMSLGSCSWVYMERPSSRFTPATEPTCTASYGTVYIDLILAGVNAAGVVAAGSGDGNETQAAAIGAFLDGLVFLLSGLTGIYWARKCARQNKLHQIFVVTSRLAGSDRSARVAPAGEFRERVTDSADGTRRTWLYEVPMTPRTRFELSYRETNGVLDDASLVIEVIVDSDSGHVFRCERIVLSTPSGVQLTLSPTWRGGKDLRTGMFHETLAADVEVADAVGVTQDVSLEVDVCGETFEIEANAVDDLRGFVTRMTADPAEAS